MSTLQEPDFVFQMAGEFSNRVRQMLGDRVREVRIFGSRARGNARPDSDLDVFVLLDRYDRPTRNRILDLAWDVGEARDFAVVLSPTVMDEAEFNLMLARERRLPVDILNEGIRV